MNWVRAHWRCVQAAALNRRLRSLQVASNVWPFVDVRAEADGVWGYPDGEKYARAMPADPGAVRAALASMGVPGPVAAKLVSGCIPLSAANNPDLAAVEAVCRAALRAAGYDVGHVPVGLGLVHYFNAGAYSSPWGHVLLLHLGAVLGLDLMNSWLLMAEGEAEAGPPDRVWGPRVAESLAYFAGKAPGVAPLSAAEAKVVEPTARVGHVMAFVQRCFILLHEFGHAVRGHRTQQGAASRRQEHEADEFAVRLLLKHGPPPGRAPAGAPGWAPPAAALGYLFAILSAAEAAHPTDHPDRSHPPAAARWERVLAVGSTYDGWGDVALPSVLPPLRGASPGGDRHG